jgi:hypothetical protein
MLGFAETHGETADPRNNPRYQDLLEMCHNVRARLLPIILFSLAGGFDLFADFNEPIRSGPDS